MAILAAVHDKKKVVVSTHTIALQEQLLKKDIPFLRAVTGLEFSAVLVKGRSNYISLRRLDVAIQRQDSLFQRPEDLDQLATIRLEDSPSVIYREDGRRYSPVKFSVRGRDLALQSQIELLRISAAERRDNSNHAAGGCS